MGCCSSEISERVELSAKHQREWSGFVSCRNPRIESVAQLEEVTPIESNNQNQACTLAF
jgi:hypothetical protein